MEDPDDLLEEELLDELDPLDDFDELEELFDESDELEDFDELEGALSS